MIQFFFDFSIFSEMTVSVQAIPLTVTTTTTTITTPRLLYYLLIVLILMYYYSITINIIVLLHYWASEQGPISGSETQCLPIKPLGV